MKTKTTRTKHISQSGSLWILAALCASLTAGATAATITDGGTAAGQEIAHWRNPAVPKTLAVSGYQIYGVDGYADFFVQTTYFFSQYGLNPLAAGAANNQISLPSYATGLTFPNSSTSGWQGSMNPTNYGTIDDPGAGGQALVGKAGFYGGYGNPQTIFTFTLVGQVPSTFRLGVMQYGTNSSPAAIVVADNNGGIYTNASPISTNLNAMGANFFDISGAAAGDVISIQLLRGISDAGITAITFDHPLAAGSATPQYVLDDYEWNRNLTFAGGAGYGAVLTRTNNRLKVLTPTTASYCGYVQSGAFPRTIAGTNLVQAMMAGGVMNVYVQCYTNDVTQNFNLKVSANFNPSTYWPTAGGNLRQLAAQSITFSPSVNQDSVLTVNCSTNAAFYGALSNWLYNPQPGEYCSFQLVNVSGNAILSTQAFYVSGLTIGPAPSAAFSTTNHVLDDYTTRIMPFDGVADSSYNNIYTTAGLSGTTNQLDIMSGTTATPGAIVRYVASSASLGRNDANMNALLSGSAVICSVQNLGSGLAPQPQNYSLELAVDSDAWVGGSGNYRPQSGAILVQSTQNGNSYVLFPYSPGTDFYRALTNYAAGHGTYLQFALDNAGNPDLNSPVEFYVNSLVVYKQPAALTGPPPPPALGISQSAGSTNVSLTWPTNQVLYHLTSATNLTGSWTMPVPGQSFSIVSGTNTDLVPATNSNSFFRLMKY